MIKQTGFSFQDADIRSIDRSQLADRSQICIDKDMGREERIREFCRQTNYHPDCMVIDGVVVLSRFSRSDVTIEDCICAAVRNAG